MLLLYAVDFPFGWFFVSCIPGFLVICVVPLPPLIWFFFWSPIPLLIATDGKMAAIATFVACGIVCRTSSWRMAAIALTARFLQRVNITGGCVCLSEFCYLFISDYMLRRFVRVPECLSAESFFLCLRDHVVIVHTVCSLWLVQVFALLILHLWIRTSGQAYALL